MTDFTTYEEELSRRGKIIHTNVGVSMMPLLRQHRDVMIIERPEGRLKKYDCPLYKTNGGRYILHRIVKVRENDYVIIGDNCVTFEKGVTDEQIIGVLTGVIRDGKTVTMDNGWYKLYYHLWCDLIYIRIPILYAVRTFKAGIRFITKPFRGKKQG